MLAGGSESSSTREDTYHIEDYPDHQTAARANSNILTIAHVADGYLEAVAAWTWVMVDLEGRIEGHILYLDFIVVRHLDV